MPSTLHDDRSWSSKFIREVIQPTACAEEVFAFRADETSGPGVIFQDMQKQIEDASIVIAEISSSNPNVYYELGYAHALRKPTILLSRRDRDHELPFDIRSYRVILYSDSIGGKPVVEQELRSHLRTILGKQRGIMDFVERSDQS